MLAHKRIIWFCAVAFTILGAACAPAAQPAAVPASAPAAPAPAKAPQQPAAPAPAAPVVAPAPAAPAAPVAAPAPAAPSEKKPRYGGAIAFAASNPQLNHLDPISYTGASTHNVVTPVYSRLVIPVFKTGTGEIAFAPELAESWEISKDGLTITFKLRKDAHFQNIDPVNGREVTSEDVKFSLERAAYDPASLFQATYRNVERFETPDKFTFVFKMKRFDAEFLFLISGRHAFIVPKEVVQKYGSVKTVLIGSGPFIFDKWVKDVGVFYKKNPSYYIKGQPYLDEFHWLIIRDQRTRITAFRTGRICCIGGAWNVVEEIIKTKPDVLVKEKLTGGSIGFGMRYGNPVFDDIRIRKALVLAVDREKYLDLVWDGRAILRGPVPSFDAGWGLSPEEQKKYWPYDPTQAKKLLQEAGYKQGLTLELLSDAGDPIDRSTIVQRLIEEYRNIGITIKLVLLERTAYSRQQESVSYKDLILGMENQSTPESYLTQNWRCGGFRNMMGLCDPKLDKAIDDMASTIDEGERKKKALDIQRFIFENFYYKINFADVYNYELYHPWVGGYEFKPSTGGNYPFEVNAIWLAK